MADYAAEDAAYAAAVKAEWGVWVANGLVYIDGALAFTDGSSVPASTVARFDLEAQGYVRPAGEPKPDVTVDVVAAPVGDPILLTAETTSPGGAAPDLELPDAAPEPDADAPTDKK